MCYAERMTGVRAIAPLMCVTNQQGHDVEHFVLSLAIVVEDSVVSSRTE